ncbi:MAG: NAD(P)/FAD-dependent oxidoreductase [Burkholderiales bacterium]
MSNPDVIVIGGGLVGSAVAYGLAHRGLSVIVLDEGDVAYRASRGNFGLVWVQSKGFGEPEYQRWTRLSSDRWSEFASRLESETGINCGHERPGGITICLTEDELAARRKLMEQLRVESGDTPFEYKMLQHEALKELLPAIGPQVVGASYTPYDGHANPLYLLRALHAALARHRGRYIPNARVSGITPSSGNFTVTAGGQRYSALKVVLASGLGNKALASHIALNVPVNPVRGQIIVTERVQPVLAMPTLTIRQTVEGTIMIGESREEAGFDDATSPKIVKQLAERAVKTFPFLKDVRVVRTWAALRVMSPDGFPIYEQSRQYPGAFVCTCHSGVTLAAVHATHYARYVAEGALPAHLQRFSSARFDVQAAA